MWSAVNVLQNSPKISDMTKGDFSNSVCLELMENYDKSAAVQIAGVFGTREHVDCRSVFWNKSFRAIK